MSELICWARPSRPRDALSALIAGLPAVSRWYMLLERVPTGWLSDEERRAGIILDALDQTLDPERWGHGRIFSEGGELRWERTGGIVHTVYCGREVELAGFQPATEINLAQLAGVTRSYFLWGRRLASRALEALDQPADEVLFAEARIPRLLRYPVSDQAQRVRLRVREYRDATGALAYYRFYGLTEEAA